MNLFGRKSEPISEEQLFNEMIDGSPEQSRLLNLFGYKVRVVVSPLAREALLVVPKASSDSFSKYLERRFGRPLEALEPYVPESLADAEVKSH